VIGVAAVVAVLAVGEGARSSVESRIRALGSNLLRVRPARGRAGAVRIGNVVTLTRADAVAIARVPGVVAVSPESNASTQVRYRESNMSTSVMGVTADYVSIRALDIASGLGFTPLDDTRRARVALIGANVADTLFGAASPLGERIQIRGITFHVVGVLTRKGDVGFASPDDFVLVPLATHQGVLFGGDALTNISVQVASEGVAAEAQDGIAQLLRLRHRLRADAEDDFEISSQTEMLATMSAIADTFTSLLVGGIGIMNIMLVSVRERTREIGVRMAVGARRRDVLLQFLVEAVVVSVAGGLVGLVLGYLGAMLIARLGGWETIVPAYSLFLSLGVSIAVGVIFGVGPARRAARLDPVAALREE